MYSSKLGSAIVGVLLCSLGLTQAGSLWREGITDERGLFADKRAKGVGDILTVVVEESVGMSNTLDLKTNKESKSGVTGFASNLLDQFITGVPNALIRRQNQSAASSSSNPIVIPSLPSLPVSGANSFNGGGAIQNNQTFSGKIAVQVTDVLPNGNLIVEGLREVNFSKERQVASLRGTVRPYDIQPNNTVLSSNVVNAEIQIISEGPLTDAQKKGWLLKINDKISPF